MPILLVIAGVGALGGYIASSSSQTVSNVEGLIIGAAIGIGIAAVWFAVKKV